MNAINLITFWPAQKPRNQRGDRNGSSYYKVFPAKAGEAIEGSFKSRSGGGNTALGGDLMVVVAAYIVFNRQGEFSIAKTAAVNSSRDIGESNSS